MKTSEFLQALEVNNEQIISYSPCTAIRLPLVYLLGKEVQNATMAVNFLADDYQNVKGILFWTDRLVRVTPDRLHHANNVVNSINASYESGTAMIDQDNDLRARLFIKVSNPCDSLNMESFSNGLLELVGICTNMMDKYYPNK